MSTDKPFGVDPYGDGYAVVDENGRTYTGVRSQRSAQATASILNAAAKTSRKALARALGAVEDGEPDMGVAAY
jgi:hypothetical protein